MITIVPVGGNSFPRSLAFKFKRCDVTANAMSTVHKKTILLGCQEDPRINPCLGGLLTWALKNVGDSKMFSPTSSKHQRLFEATNTQGMDIFPEGCACVQDAEFPMHSLWQRLVCCLTSKLLLPANIII